MTAANVLLIFNGQPQLFSVSSDAYPDSIDRIVDCCLDLTQPDVNLPPDGIPELVLRTDSSYVYLMNLDTRQARCWKNRSILWGETQRVLKHQMKQEVDLRPYLPQLPPDWAIVPGSDSIFGNFPVESVALVATAWDNLWQRLSGLAHQLATSPTEQVARLMRMNLPAVPLAMPYNRPRNLDGKNVHFMTQEGVWLDVSVSPGQLERKEYDQFPPTEIERLFSAWLVAV